MKAGTPEWHAARAKLLTASDFGAALGLNPYCSRQKLWRIKTGLESVGDNFHMRRGTEHESDAIFIYQVVAGVLVGEVGLALHPAHAWIACTPDGAVGGDGLVEAKCPAQFRDEPPVYHVAQIQGQLECTDRAWCDYVQWVDGEIRVYRVIRSPAWWAWALPQLRAFWAYVERMEEPPRMRKADKALIDAMPADLAGAASET